MPNRNIELLKGVARRLGPLLPEVVFVGGCTTGLFITDEAAAEVRSTFDVDVIAEIGSYAAYAEFSERLRGQGFREDTSEGAPVCRWLIDEMKLDVMPSDEKILRFSNQWYGPAIDAAQEMQMEKGLRIRVVTAPYFIATKLEAFRGRGRGDYGNSSDLEDLVAVLDGRPGIVREIAAEARIRSYVSEQFRSLLGNPSFVDGLPGYFPPDEGSQGRIPIVMQRIRLISAGQG
jgi:hypothetical protein